MHFFFSRQQIQYRLFFCFLMPSCVLHYSVIVNFHNLYFQCGWFVGLIKPIFSDILFNHFPFYYIEMEAGNKAKKSQNRYDDTPGRSSDDLNIRVATIGVKFALLNRKRNIELANYIQRMSNVVLALNNNNNNFY